MFLLISTSDEACPNCHRIGHPKEHAGQNYKCPYIDWSPGIDSPWKHAYCHFEQLLLLSGGTSERVLTGKAFCGTTKCLVRNQSVGLWTSSVASFSSAINLFPCVTIVRQNS